MFDGWVVCCNCKYCDAKVYCMGNCELTSDFIFTDLPRICPYYIPAKEVSTCEGFVKVNNDILKSKEKNTMKETGKIFDEISEILNKKNEEIKELEEKISAYEKLVKEKDKEIESLNVTKEFYINRAKELAAERDDFSKKWDKSLCKLVEKEEEIDEFKKQIDSAFYDILDSDKLGLPHYNYLTRSNRYPIYRHNGDNNMVTKDFTLVGYLYVKDIDEDVNLYSKTISEVKSWCIGEAEVYEDDTRYVKIPKHHIAIVHMRKDGIEAVEKWVIE